jgi:hypothetical protein
MSISTSPKKQWVITQDSFDKLLALLDPDRERAGEQYEKIRRKLVKHFLKRRCAHADECVDETFNRVAQKIFEGNKVFPYESTPQNGRKIVGFSQ